MPEQLESLEVDLDLGNYADRFLTCRALAHLWYPVGTPWVETRDEFQIVLERFSCSRCGTQRTDQRSIYGVFLRRSYKHEEGFSLPKELNRKDNFARERFHRILGSLAPTQEQVSA